MCSSDLSAMNMLGHALRAVETGAASVILVTGGDATGLGGYAKVAANLNIATQLHLAPLGHALKNGIAGCIWHLPITSKGKTIRGTVTVTVQGVKASRSFSAKIT